MLKELQTVIEVERRDNPEAGETDEIALQMMRAARDLMTRQIIHSDDHHHKASWSLLLRHRLYFDHLMEAFGYDLVVDTLAEYVMVLPREAAMSGRRGQIGKTETLVLFALRVLWEESSRQGDQDERGWVDVDTSILIDHLASLGATAPIRKGEMRTLLDDLRRRGIIRVGAEDLEEESIPIRIAPVISKIVTPGLAQALLDYLDREEMAEEGTSVLDFIEAQEAAPSDAAAPAAPAEDDLFGDTRSGDRTIAAGEARDV